MQQTNGNAAAGNISKLPIQSLLYSGATTKIYAHLVGWFGASDHMNVGYQSDDANQVHRQVTDMMSRGIAGVIIDWHGPSLTIINKTAMLMKTEAESRSGQFQFAITEDARALASSAAARHCDVTDQIIDDHIRCHINPTGNFLCGGPHGDCGLTGRKIIVDTYGGRGRHGGGAFSGKDPTKVDRSAAYMARYIAKNIVAAELASQCEVQLSYAIGYPKPINIWVCTFGSAGAGLTDGQIAALIGETFDLTPAGIIKTLDLRRPIYKETARHGHFGRELPSFTWETTGHAAILRRAVGVAA